MDDQKIEERNKTFLQSHLNSETLKTHLISRSASCKKLKYNHIISTKRFFKYSSFNEFSNLFNAGSNINQNNITQNTINNIKLTNLEKIKEIDYKTDNENEGKKCKRNS